ncbi:Uncharacterised protein [Mycobacterium tuberculosis]|nr:Uncharacterised protein [Mycobacterium tuberculosis]
MLRAISATSNAMIAAIPRPIKDAFQTCPLNSACTSSTYTPEPMIQPQGSNNWIYEVLATGASAPGLGQR